MNIVKLTTLAALTAAFLSAQSNVQLPTNQLPTKKMLNLAAMKSMAAAVEAEANKRNVHVSIAIVDDSLNLLYLEKMDDATLNTVAFAQKKARHAAAYHAASRLAAEQFKSGNMTGLAMPDYFPNGGGLPIKLDGVTIGGLGVSGAASEVDEAIAQAALDNTPLK